MTTNLPYPSSFWNKVSDGHQPHRYFSYFWGSISFKSAQTDLAINILSTHLRHHGSWIKPRLHYYMTSNNLELSHKINHKWYLAVELSTINFIEATVWLFNTHWVVAIKWSTTQYNMLDVILNTTVTLISVTLYSASSCWLVLRACAFMWCSAILPTSYVRWSG